MSIMQTAMKMALIRTMNDPTKSRRRTTPEPFGGTTAPNHNDSRQPIPED